MREIESGNAGEAAETVPQGAQNQLDMRITTSNYSRETRMSEPDSIDLGEEQQETLEPVALRPRPVGSPLSTGVSRRAVPSAQEGSGSRTTPPPPGRAFGQSSEESSSAQGAASLVHAVLPIVQRLLPLFDGSFASTISNLLAPHAQHHLDEPPASAKLDLAPIEDGLAELRSQQHGLRVQVTEQNTSLKRVEDQLEMVREATDRNTLEQQELLEDLKAYGTKIKVIAVVALVLAAGGVVMTLALYLHMKKVLP